jgi:hypothetical protein
MTIAESPPIDTALEVVVIPRRPGKSWSDLIHSGAVTPRLSHSTIRRVTPGWCKR